MPALTSISAQCSKPSTHSAVARVAPSPARGARPQLPEQLAAPLVDSPLPQGEVARLARVRVGQMQLTYLIGNSRAFCTVLSAKLECTRATPGRRVKCLACSLSKSAVSATTARTT